MKIAVTKTMVVVLVFASLVFGGPAGASDVEELSEMVQFFLANANEESAHARFWADDLVYTSSAGLRFGKAEIMSGFDDSATADIAASDESAITYSGEDIDVRVYGNTAVVAFRLVGTPTDGSAVLGYFNTGTFLKRDGDWQVVAWQATRIPPP
jgi:ketosteroid isomerase-like protein